MLTNIDVRHDFMFVFDVQNGNPNGDPDAGNLPRVNPLTMRGLVTDVCIKRKIRDAVQLIGGCTEDTDNEYELFIRNDDIPLVTKQHEAAKTIGIDPTKKVNKKTDTIVQKEMCRKYWDIRMFGAVLNIGKVNGGQVRGPMQLTMSESVVPICPTSLCITRVSITKEGENKETEMGRKNIVPYGLYVGYGFFSPAFAQKTGVTKHDLALFWEAISRMFDLNRSASSGLMALRNLTVFSHDSALGSCPSHWLFDTVSVKPVVDNPASFGDYSIEHFTDNLPNNIQVATVLRKED